MAITVEELKILVRAETAKAQRELKNFRTSTKNTKTDAKALIKSLVGPLGLAAGIALVGKSASTFIKEGVKFNMQLEQMHVGFKTLLGSGYAAENMMSDIATLASSTPLQMAGLATGAKRLLAFGTEASNVVDTMRRLGDAAMGNQETLDRLTDAYGKVQAKGKASLEELNRFTEAGVPIMKQLGENLGLTNEELFKYISAGKVGFAEVDRALTSLTTGQGQFAGMMAAQSETLAGRVSTLKDNYSFLRAELTQFLTPALKGATEWINSKVESMRTAIAVANAYKRVVNETAEEVKELSHQEQIAFAEARLRDYSLIMADLEKKLATESGANGGWAKVMKDMRDGFKGLLTDQDLTETTRSLGEEIQAVQGSITLWERYINNIKRVIIEKRNLADVPIPGAGSGVGTGSGSGSDAGSESIKFPEITALAEMITGAQDYAAALAEIMNPNIGLPALNPLMSDLNLTMLDNAKALSFVSKGIEENKFQLLSADVARARDNADSLIESWEAMGSPTVGIPSINPILESLGLLMYDFSSAAESTTDVLDEQLITLTAINREYEQMMLNVYNVEAATRSLTDAEKIQIATAESMAATMDSLGNSLLSTFGSATLGGLTDVSEAMAANGVNSDEAASALLDYVQALADALPQLLLSAGLSLVSTPDPSGTALALGVGLIAASGLVAVANGIAKGARESESTVPAVQAIQRASSKTVTVNNYNGTYLDSRTAGRALTASGAADYRGY